MVWACDRMMNILTSSTAKSLVQLRSMAIIRCKMITEIMVADDDEGDNYAAKDEIFFSELNWLELLDLKGLKNFYSVNNCAFEFLL